MDIYFEQHGGKTVFFGRFIGFLRALAPFAAGMAKMSYSRFIRYNAPGGILWFLCFTLLGYFFGHGWRLIEKQAGKIGLVVLLLILAIAGFGYLYRLAVKNQDRITTWLANAAIRIFGIAAMERLALHHQRLAVFLKERFSPARYLGLHLTVGLILCAFFGWALGFITDSILKGEPLVFVDAWVADWFSQSGAPM